MYTNMSTMKKFIELLRNKEINEKDISLPIRPMSIKASTNPPTTVGVTGLRYIQKGGGVAVWPVFYLEKDQVRKIILNGVNSETGENSKNLNIIEK